MVNVLWGDFQPHTPFSEPCWLPRLCDVTPPTADEKGMWTLDPRWSHQILLLGTGKWVCGTPNQPYLAPVHRSVVREGSRATEQRRRQCSGRSSNAAASGCWLSRADFRPYGGLTVPALPGCRDLSKLPVGVCANCVPHFLKCSRPFSAHGQCGSNRLQDSSVSWPATFLTAFFLCILKDTWIETFFPSPTCSPTTDVFWTLLSTLKSQGAGQQRAEEQFPFSPWRFHYSTF